MQIADATARWLLGRRGRDGRGNFQGVRVSIELAHDRSLLEGHSQEALAESISGALARPPS